MLPYQFHWKHRAATLNNPAATTSTKAIRNDLCGEKPAVTIASKWPSELQGTIKLPDLMPLKAFLATSSGFIAPEDSANMLVSGGRTLFSATNRIFLVENHITKVPENRMIFFIFYFLTLLKTRSVCIGRENQRNMNIVCNNLLLQSFC